MLKKISLGIVILVIAIMTVAPVFASGQSSNTLASYWMPDPLYTGTLNPDPSVNSTGYWWRDTTNQNALANHLAATYPQVPYVETVVPGVYVARGIGLNNCVAVVGDSEWFLIDAMDSPSAMSLALVLFRPYVGTRKIAGLIYTGAAADHYSGSYVAAPLYSIPVYASSQFLPVLSQYAAVAGIGFPRQLLVNGSYLQPGPDGKLGPQETVGRFPFQYPSVSISTETHETIAGYDVVLTPAPSADGAGLMVWLPSLKVLDIGDAFSPSFPNLGPLTGPSPSPTAWIDTLQMMTDLNPDYAIPTHGDVLSPASEIQATLGTYHDVIKYLHDRTLYYMNLGLTPDEIVPLIQLPAPWSSNVSYPYLQGYDNSMASSIKAMYDEYAGWFDGEPTELASTLTTEAKAEVMVDLAGGMSNMIVQARNAELAAEDQASADKALLIAYSAYTVCSNTNSPYLTDAGKIYVQALRKDAYMQTSSQVRYYYLSTAFLTENNLPAETNPLSITITAPADGAQYFSSNVTQAAYTVTDSTDPNPTVSATGWSDAPGTHTFTVTATDSSGNTANASVTYSVVAAPTITVTGGIFTYDGNAHPATAAATGLDGSPVAGNFTFSYNAGGAAAPLNAGTYTVTATFTSADSDYVDGSGTATVTINPAPASVTPLASSKTYGQPDPVFTGDLTGFLPADNVVASYSRTPGETVDGGPYTISATLSPAAILGNYTITYNTATFTILKADPAITVTSYNVTYDGNPHTATGNATGVKGESLLAGLDLSGTTHTNPGSYTDNWTFTDTNGNYNDAGGSVNDTIGYGFSGLLSPYTSKASFNTGSTVPLTWQYLDASGNVIDSANAAPKVSITGTDSTGATIAIAVTTPGNSGLQYDPTTMTWQLNWQTKGLSTGNYNVSIKSQQTGQTEGPFPLTLAAPGNSGNSNGKNK